MKPIFAFVFTLTVISSICFGQGPDFSCSADEMNSQAFQAKPELQQTILNASQELEQFTENFVQNYVSNKSGDPYIIPIVFHVIHDYGISNISEEQIKDAVKNINIQLRKQNPDTTEIVDEFKHLASDLEIEVRLAKKDPEGNCTNGITRTYSPLTNVGDHQVKSLIQWPPDKYLNIYVCASATMGLAGHALMPAVAEAHPEWDGIVIQHSYVGSIGTSNDFKKTVLTHEIGHYLNLYHIWGGNNVPDFYYLPVGQADNCDHDDNVEDTPNTIGWSDCPTDATSCGTLDNVQNYMDYSYCHKMFTLGQKQRIHATLNSPVANRNNLWTTQNLIETGVIDAEELCVVNFIADKRVICAGESVTFTDISYHGVANREWGFLLGGDITTSSDSIVTVTYNQPGIYDIALTVSDNDNNTLYTTKTAYIQVLESEPTHKKIMDNFENIEYSNQMWVMEDAHDFRMKRTNYGNGSSYSVFAENYSLGNNNIYFMLQSQSFDASEYTTYYVSFDYAYAKGANINTEKITIQTSNNCGLTWSTRQAISLTEYSTESEEEFYPDSNTEWFNAQVSFAAGAHKSENQLIRLRLDSKGGNNVFLDNINIFNEDELSITQESLQDKLVIYPNPSKGIFNIVAEDKALNGTVEVVNIYGQVITQLEVQNKKNFSIDIQGVANGTYFVKYIPKMSNKSPIVKKILLNQ